MPYLYPVGMVVVPSDCVPEGRPRVPYADKRKERRYHRRCAKRLIRGAFAGLMSDAERKRLVSCELRAARRVG